MQAKETTTLDYINNLQVPGSVFSEPANEYAALLTLWSGLEFLNKQADSIEQEAIDRLNADRDKRILAYGNVPELRGMPLRLMTCAFHWYAVSACNYVRTVGAIAKPLDSDNKPMSPRRYTESVIPHVLTFRDKVAAHLAWASDHSDDTNADRLMSILPQVQFEDDALVVGALEVGVRLSGQSSIAYSMEPWSITKVHKRLRERYWPIDSDL